jgi:hypothetical protein
MQVQTMIFCSVTHPPHLQLLQSKCSVLFWRIISSQILNSSCSKRAGSNVFPILHKFSRLFLTFYHTFTSWRNELYYARSLAGEENTEEFYARSLAGEQNIEEFYAISLAEEQNTEEF